MLLLDNRPFVISQTEEDLMLAHELLELSRSRAGAESHSAAVCTSSYEMAAPAPIISRYSNTMARPIQNGMLAFI
jgi:hypothetical protein